MKKKFEAFTDTEVQLLLQQAAESSEAGTISENAKALQLVRDSLSKELKDEIDRRSSYKPKSTWSVSGYISIAEQINLIVSKNAGKCFSCARNPGCTTAKPSECGRKYKPIHTGLTA